MMASEDPTQSTFLCLESLRLAASFATINPISVTTKLAKLTATLQLPVASLHVKTNRHVQSTVASVSTSCGLTENLYSRTNPLTGCGKRVGSVSSGSGYDLNSISLKTCLARSLVLGKHTVHRRCNSA